MQLKNLKSDRGSVLLVTLAFVVIVSIAIIGYLQLVRSQSAFVSRSQSWNAALALSEAGAEDGFALLNKNQMSFFTPAYGMPEEQATEYFGKGIPFPKRMGRATEYAHLVQSIVENDYLNGETIRIDAALRFAPK